MAEIRLDLWTDEQAAQVQDISFSLDRISGDVTKILVETPAYTPSNVVTDRSYDANATTVAELADVLGTLIADLQAKGIIT